MFDSTSGTGNVGWKDVYLTATNSKIKIEVISVECKYANTSVAMGTGTFKNTYTKTPMVIPVMHAMDNGSAYISWTPKLAMVNKTQCHIAVHSSAGNIAPGACFYVPCLIIGT